MPIFSQTTGPLESSPRMLAFDFSWGFSLTLWHTHLIKAARPFPAHHAMMSWGLSSWASPCRQDLSESRRVSIGLRPRQWGCFVILLVESKSHLVIFPNVVFRGKKKKKASAWARAAHEMPGALLCYPWNQVHLVRYLNNLTRIHSHSPIAIFLLRMPNRWVQCKHGRRTPGFFQS